MNELGWFGWGGEFATVVVLEMVESGVVVALLFCGLCYVDILSNGGCHLIAWL